MIIKLLKKVFNSLEKQQFKKKRQNIRESFTDFFYYNPIDKCIYGDFEFSVITKKYFKTTRTDVFGRDKKNAKLWFWLKTFLLLNEQNGLTKL